MGSNSTATKKHDQIFLQRHFPRKTVALKVGVLSRGFYFVSEINELGEGGITLLSEFVLTEESEVVVSFQIPNGDFAFIRGLVVSTEKQMGDPRVTHSIRFTEIDFTHKRQIRTFVSI